MLFRLIVLPGQVPIEPRPFQRWTIQLGRGHGDSPPVDIYSVSHPSLKHVALVTTLVPHYTLLLAVTMVTWEPRNAAVNGYL